MFSVQVTSQSCPSLFAQSYPGAKFSLNSFTHLSSTGRSAELVDVSGTAPSHAAMNQWKLSVITAPPFLGPLDVFAFVWFVVKVIQMLPLPFICFCGHVNCLYRTKVNLKWAFL